VAGDRPEALPRRSRLRRDSAPLQLPRIHEKPLDTICRFADLLEVDAERVRLWTFARAAAESRDDWADDWTTLARLLARSPGL
jgi:predicted nuclease of restriction endonuclease-like RecB superfamily